MAVTVEHRADPAPRDPGDHPALDRLHRLERRLAPSPAGPGVRRADGVGGAVPTMGQQPALDGLRALSVLAVIVYHGGFTFLGGGFLGVEVFFVVSGFLITTLLLEERARTGGVSLRGFWTRRARRLLPALFAMLLVVSVWGALWGSAQQQWQLRRDLPWSLGYLANWGQILGEVPYFAGGDPPLLRHLWSLAVEEQWYLLWPLAFLGLVALPVARRTIGWVLLGLAGGVMVLTWWLARGPVLTSDRTNFLYLSTLTRSSGLLLGAGAAMCWQPWRRSVRSGAALVTERRSRVVDAAGIVAVAAVALTTVIAHVDDRATYRWVLPVVSVASLVAVLVAVDPASRWMRPLLSTRPLVEIGRRSYGLYLWSWPITVIAGATLGAESWVRFVVAMAVTVPVSEACYRWIETPIRRGEFGLPVATGPRLGLLGSGALLLASIALFFGSVSVFDPARGGRDVAFALPSAATGTVAAADGSGAVAPVDAGVAGAGGGTTGDVTGGGVAGGGVTGGAATGAVPTDAAVVASTVPAAPSSTAPVLPRSVVIVGDSQAHSLAVNLPTGIDEVFTISNGAVEGCSVYDDGIVRSSRNGFRRSFADCAGWADRWERAARESQAEVALVVLGAWDVFDVEVDGVPVPFATPESDRRFTDGVLAGVAALRSGGSHVALMEVPCMRPQDVEGAGVPALPERGDDTRVARLNDLLRGIAASTPGVTFVEGPDAWCTDPAISADLGYRWDGVHVYKPGAALIYETIAPSLLAIPIPAS